MRSRFPSGWLCLLALLPAGCGGPAPPAETPPPPEAMPFLSEQEVAARRAAKDEEFRTDPDSPLREDLRASFRGLQYWPYNPSWRFAVRLHRWPEEVPFILVTTSGKERPAARVGYVEFDHGGKRWRLQVYRLRDLPPGHEDDLFLPFRDATSGRETYAAGRYVDLAPGPDGWYVLDFNLAYHPLCAYGRKIYVCPRTPEENTLPFPVRAGEKGWVHAGDPSIPGDDGSSRRQPASPGGE